MRRAVDLDTMDLPTALALIDLYQKQGKSSEAADLSGKIKLAMSQAPDANGGEQQVSTGNFSKPTEEVYKNIRVLKGIPSEAVDSRDAIHLFIPRSGVQFLSC